MKVARFQARGEQDLAPIGEIEKLLARSIIWLAWRMERAPGVEAGLHLWNRYSESRESIIGWDEQQYRSKVSAATTQTHAAEIESAKKDEGAMLRSVNGLAERNIERGFSAHAWDLQACIRLERYEARIERRLRKTIVQLQVRQASRRSAISQPINDNAPTRNKKRSNKANCKVQSMTVRNSVPTERRAVPLPRVGV